MPSEDHWSMGIRAQGLAGLGGDAPSHTSARQAPLVWRAPEGPEGLAAVPVGGGGAWPWRPLAAAKTVSNKCRT